MMRRRMVGRSIARVAVGTAVVAGTAGAVSHHQQQKYAQKDAAAQQQDAAAQQQVDQAYQQGAADAQAQQQAYAPPPPAPAPAAPGSDLTAQLQQLAQLHESGVLTDEEFTAAKQKLLAG